MRKAAGGAVVDPRDAEAPGFPEGKHWDIEWKSIAYLGCPSSRR
jgi:hypothetical protein